jgi:hypothetical protein
MLWIILLRAYYEGLGWVVACVSAYPSYSQVIEILTHINKRVKEQHHIKLPLADLLSLYLDTTDQMVRNFAVVYVDMAYDRCENKRCFTSYTK